MQLEQKKSLLKFTSFETGFMQMLQSTKVLVAQPKLVNFSNIQSYVNTVISKNKSN